MSSFILRIVTPVGEFYSGEIDYMSYEAHDGRVGLMSGAAFRVGVLRAGVINVKTAVIDFDIICDGGIIIVDGDVTVLSESCRFESDEPSENVTAAAESADADFKFAKAKILANLKSVKDSNRKKRL